MTPLSFFVAFLDILPVVFFIWATFILLRDVEHLMDFKGFSLLAAGSVMVIVAAVYKCLWKVLYYTGICDFTILNASFFIISATGFLLSGIGSLFLFDKKSGVKALSIVPVYSSSLIFVIFNVAGLAALRICLAVIAKKQKCVKAMVMLLVSIPTMLMMGYMSSKDFTQPVFNLIAEVINSIGQLLFLLALISMDRAGLKTFQLQKESIEA